ncbi:carbohydrate ABC transporter permease [Nocardia sp. NPDC058379]|uniref:carbohydrate ABC transporter permease n=1 Tax=unclassified Nocardia TaxID=2637762 RepID=UPI0036630799
MDSQTTPEAVTGRFVELAPPSAPSTGAALAVRRSWLRRAAAAAPPYLYVLPALTGLIVWIYWPLVQTFQLSFYDWDLLPTTAARPVGLSNYREVIALPELGQAALNTVVYIVGLLPFTLLLPLAIALVSQQIGGRARAFYRAAIFAPFLVAPVATAVLWRWLLEPQGGLVNRSLGVLGIESVNWLREPVPALVAIIVMVGWQLLGFAVLVISAGLANISADYADTAAVDGATRWQIVRRITLPLLSPTLLLMTLLTVLATAQLVFPLINTLTQGGPGDATTNLYYLLYETAFTSFDVGRASAAGVLFFCAFGIFALGAVRLLDRWSFHDD